MCIQPRNSKSIYNNPENKLIEMVRQYNEKHSDHTLSLNEYDITQYLEFYGHVQDIVVEYRHLYNNGVCINTWYLYDLCFGTNISDTECHKGKYITSKHTIERVKKLIEDNCGYIYPYGASIEYHKKLCNEIENIPEFGINYVKTMNNYNDIKKQI